jgi:hypothetical protein
MQNPNCDGGVCLNHKGQVRVLPSGGDSNLILCQACFFHEIAWRKERNKDLCKENHFKLPKWEDLKVYGAE